jgi:hypothetical protein
MLDGQTVLNRPSTGDDTALDLLRAVFPGP